MPDWNYSRTVLAGPIPNDSFPKAVAQAIDEIAKKAEKAQGIAYPDRDRKVGGLEALARHIRGQTLDHQGIATLWEYERDSGGNGKTYQPGPKQTRTLEHLGVTAPAPDPEDVLEELIRVGYEDVRGRFNQRVQAASEEQQRAIKELAAAQRIAQQVPALAEERQNLKAENEALRVENAELYEAIEYLRRVGANGEPERKEPPRRQPVEGEYRIYQAASGAYEILWKDGKQSRFPTARDEHGNAVKTIEEARAIRDEFVAEGKVPPPPEAVTPDAAMHDEEERTVSPTQTEGTERDPSRLARFLGV